MISVIVPVYNAEKYLDDCMEAIINQTYSDLQIILVDDGSTDTSYDICEKYKSDKRVVVIHKKNGGAASARNVGLRNVKGEYIAFVDADDIVRLDYFETLLKTMICTNADIVITSFAYSLSSVMNSNKDEVSTYVFSGRDCVLENFGSLCVETVSPWVKLFKSLQFEGIYFPDGRVAEDEYVFYKILYSLKKCVYISQKMYFYRKHEGSVTTIRSIKMEEDKVEAFREKADYFKDREDIELYTKSLKCCMQHLAQEIYLLDKIGNSEINSKKNQFKNYYKEYISLHISTMDKIKFSLFQINIGLYIKVKRCVDKWGDKKHINDHN